MGRCQLVFAVLIVSFHTGGTYAQQPLPRDYLGVELGMTIEQAKARLPLTCRPSDAGGHACYYSGDAATNATYRLLLDLTDLSLHFAQDRLIVMMADHHGGSFADILAFSKTAYGQPTFSTQNVLGMFREDHYTWQDQKTESALWHSTGRNFYGDPVNAWVAVLRDISARLEGSGHPIAYQDDSNAVGSGAR